MESKTINSVQFEENEGVMKLQEYLKKYKIKQRVFAKMVGVSEQTVSHWLSGYCNPSYENAIKIYSKTKREVTLEDMGL